MRKTIWVLGGVLLFCAGCAGFREYLGGGLSGLGALVTPPPVEPGELAQASVLGGLAALLPPPWNWVGGAVVVVGGWFTGKSMKNSEPGKMFGPVAAKKEGESTDKPPAATA